MQDNVFPYTGRFNMSGCLRFTYKEPSQIALNPTMSSQTKMCIAKSLCDPRFSEILLRVEP
jgi:hypothetical protein